jgi:hypothetical protein
LLKYFPKFPAPVPCLSLLLCACFYYHMLSYLFISHALCCTFQYFLFINILQHNLSPNPPSIPRQLHPLPVPHLRSLPGQHLRLCLCLCLCLRLCLRRHRNQRLYPK